MGADDGSGDVFVGDPAVPVDSELGVQLLAVNAQLLTVWADIQAARVYGLRHEHHRHDFEQLADVQQQLLAAIRAGQEDDRR